MTGKPDPRSRIQPAHGGPDAQGAVPHDFSTNGNACGPCPPVVDALRAVDASTYPDPAYTALRASLAAFHDVAPERIVVAASASEFIFRITAAVARTGGRRVHLPCYSYGDYAKAASGWGLEIRRATSEGSDAESGEDDDDATLVWHCDPSSPLGRRSAGLGASIDALPTNATCVLDLAYEPLRLDGSLDLNLQQRDRVWQLWTPNKALGLTGIRAAYAIAPRHGAFPDDVERRQAAVLDHVDALAPSWSLGTHGVALLERWTHEESQRWLLESRDSLRGWKSAQIALCESLGWAALPSVANFFCLRPAASSTYIADLAVRLRASGIKVRDTTSFGLPGHLRVAALGPASQAALGRALVAVRA